MTSVPLKNRDQALSFLESIPLQILSQINTSLIILNSHETKRPKAGKSGKKIKEVDEEADVDEMLIDETEDVQVELKKGRGGRGAVKDWDHVGVEMKLLNRKTG